VHALFLHHETTSSLHPCQHSKGSSKQQMPPPPNLHAVPIIVVPYYARTCTAGARMPSSASACNHALTCPVMLSVSPGIKGHPPPCISIVQPSYCLPVCRHRAPLFCFPHDCRGVPPSHCPSPPCRSWSTAVPQNCFPTHQTFTFLVGEPPRRHHVSELPLLYGQCLSP
jgi:hypothetical protein